ncbi:serine hydrolase [Serratia marcescens]|uniref:serine hydrolase domain-containing protein n=1 Tax=Serratia TaxID=613 RepID=UPI00115267EC|nr:serine hydrolase [Serratia marcescens]QDI18397.1 serine hydrolase [Serratia marcescens]QDI28140.1 serine hydrolase [Serratia marcescens]QDI42647.1 serine hydrolase [Serratia marcescens]QDI57076.1 serine hydrolase [Serratia marcescens]QLJ65629.1 serine hydrolase [Serratia marcescens]
MSCEASDVLATCKNLLSVLLLALASSGHSQAAADISDPVRLGIMQGFPPAADKRVTTQNAFEFPNLRWALRNARALTPTTDIRRAITPLPLAAGPSADFDRLRFTVAEQSLSLPEYLRQTFTDGFIVLHQGKIVYERYLDSFSPEQPHIWASMTKSVTGLLAAGLIAEGKLDPSAKLSVYVPELAGTPFGEATLQQNLDMQVEAVYPAHLPPDIGLFAAVGIVPQRPGMPDNIYGFLLAASRPEQASATPIWYYQNGSPEAVAWAMRRVTGKSWSALVAERIWSLFAEDDAYSQVDALGTEMASGGLSSTLRDAARFAEAIRLAWSRPYQTSAFTQAVQLALLPNTSQALIAHNPRAKERIGYAYRDYWYQKNDGDGSIEAAGRFGQRIYINPKRELVIVKMSSAPDMAPRATQAGAAPASGSQPADTVAAFNSMVSALLPALP